ncbi:hypothetical protein [Paenibacillus pinihumi]|uniref:hypothetical protein n=1 Tax=Paenibacillus pinihumi TaxID=669462 RepID=UPI000491DA74|nr:hypothetical protein [Paenibacillus pinihumi]
MEIKQNGDRFTLELSRPQLTRIALAIGAQPPEWFVREAKDYVGIDWSVTADWGNEYPEMLSVLGIDVE